MAGEKKPRSKSKHRNVQIWKKFKVEVDKVSVLGSFCNRCGAGTFMAVHKNRIVCGKCGYGEQKKISQKPV